MTRQSESITELATALISAQVAIENPNKNKQGYGYKYAELAVIIEQVKPILQKHGLAVTQLAIDDGNGRIGVETMLVHMSGQYIASTLTMPIPEMKGSTVTQAAGAALTYARRYALSAILNIAADDDTDATKPKESKDEEFNYVNCSDCGIKNLQPKTVDFSQKTFGRALCYSCQQKQNGTKNV